MIIAKCIHTFRKENGTIYGYRLIDRRGQIRDIKSIQLRKAMIENKIQVVNLRLTKDYRIIGTKYKADSNDTEKAYKNFMSNITKLMKEVFISSGIAERSKKSKVNLDPPTCEVEDEERIKSSKDRTNIYYAYIEDLFIDKNDIDEYYSIVVKLYIERNKTYAEIVLQDDSLMDVDSYSIELEAPVYLQSNFENVREMITNFANKIIVSGNMY